MNDPLTLLLADGVIDEVCARLKSGKEADLWLVRQGDEIVAAKVYKERQTRSFRNNAGYLEGRRVRDTRTQRAMDRGSRFGQAAAEEAWKAKEADALHALHAAGVRVPTPVMFYEGVLLMEYVVDAQGQPAPRLLDANIPSEQAAALYADLRNQAIRMLGCDLIHGDLSPYNVLMGWNGPVVIDFPQVIGAAHNSRAEWFFQRDLENLRHFFAGIDPALQSSAGDAREIWRAYVRRELTPDFVPTSKSAAPAREGHGHAHRNPQARRDRPQQGASRGGDRPRSEPRDRPGALREGGTAPSNRDGRSNAPPTNGGAIAARSGGGLGAPRRGPPPGSPRFGGPQERLPPRNAQRRDRRLPPGPEVIHVRRPPLGSPSTAPASSNAPHPLPANTSAESASPPNGPHPHHRRHRRHHH